MIISDIIYFLLFIYIDIIYSSVNQYYSHLPSFPCSLFSLFSFLPSSLPSPLLFSSLFFPLFSPHFFPLLYFSIFFSPFLLLRPLSSLYFFSILTSPPYLHFPLLFPLFSSLFNTLFSLPSVLPSCLLTSSPPPSLFSSSSFSSLFSLLSVLLYFLPGPLYLHSIS